MKSNHICGTALATRIQKLGKHWLIIRPLGRIILLAIPVAITDDFRFFERTQWRGCIFPERYYINDRAALRHNFHELETVDFVGLLRFQREPDSCFFIPRRAGVVSRSAAALDVFFCVTGGYMKKIAVFRTEVGFFRLVEEDHAIVGLESWFGSPGEAGEKNPLLNNAMVQLQEYFAGRRTIFSFPYRFIGTPFQMRVWRALCGIPYGETRTYGEIAREAGNLHACRAVGMANHRNPIMIVVPCHRVIGANGKLTGYAGGVALKSALLELERKYRQI